MSSNVRVLRSTAIMATAASSGRNRSKQRTLSPLIAVIRRFWPENTAPTLASFAKLQPRQAEYYLQGRYRLSSKALKGLIKTQHGLEILEAWLTEDGSPLPDWFAALKYEAEMASVRARQVALRAQQKEIGKRLQR